MKKSNLLRHTSISFYRTAKSFHGFTLLEMAVVLAIAGVIAVFAIGITQSIQNMTKAADTKIRMAQIVKKAKSYYRGHGTLPGDSFDATSVIITEVPVGQNDLNMEQKYRLDAWGQYLYYFRDHNRFSISYDCIPSGFSDFCMFQIDAQTKTLIQRLDVNGGNYAGVIISYGPNQVLDTTISDGTQDYFTWGRNIIYQSAGDDIIMPIDVTEEAVEIAIEDLLILQDKVKAFDRLFAAIDNDNDTFIDESDDVPCPSTSCPPSSGSDDPKNGTTTLDHMKAKIYLGLDCPCNLTGSHPDWNKVETFRTMPSRPEIMDETTRAFFYCFYNLPDNHMVDPWLSGYIWGCGNAVCQNINGEDREYPMSDPRYHRFFSAGPDRTPDTPGAMVNDIVP